MTDLHRSHAAVLYREHLKPFLAGLSDAERAEVQSLDDLECEAFRARQARTERPVDVDAWVLRGMDDGGIEEVCFRRVVAMLGGAPPGEGFLE